MINDWEREEKYLSKKKKRLKSYIYIYYIDIIPIKCIYFVYLTLYTPPTTKQ